MKLIKYILKNEKVLETMGIHADLLNLNEEFHIFMKLLALPIGAELGILFGGQLAALIYLLRQPLTHTYIIHTLFYYIHTHTHTHTHIYIYARKNWLLPFLKKQFSILPSFPN